MPVFAALFSSDADAFFFYAVTFIIRQVVRRCRAPAGLRCGYHDSAVFIAATYACCFLRCRDAAADALLLAAAACRRYDFLIDTDELRSFHSAIDAYFHYAASTMIFAAAIDAAAAYATPALDDATMPPLLILLSMLPCFRYADYFDADISHADYADTA